MMKDSKLIIEVEKFLRMNGIDKYRMSYDRGIEMWEYEKHPKFDIELDRLKILKRLSKRLDIPLENDYHNLKRKLIVENEKYNMCIYKKIPYRIPSEITKK